MRLGKPAGLYAFYVPYIIGISYAACIADEAPPLEHMVFLSGLFLVGSVILRGAACAWNDNMDQDFDRKVTRCRHRPIARGAVSTTQGHIFTAALTSTALPLFALLPSQCLYHTVPIPLLFALYPFAKRVTYYPQVVLGFPFAWAIFMSCAALNVDPFAAPQSLVPTASLFSAKRPLDYHLRHHLRTPGHQRRRQFRRQVHGCPFCRQYQASCGYDGCRAIGVARADRLAGWAIACVFCRILWGRVGFAGEHDRAG